MSINAFPKNGLITPYLKWAGGKRQLIPTIKEYIPRKFDTYYEPFVGAGAVFFYLQNKQAVINDVNAELINTYKVIRNNVDELISQLKIHEKKNDKEYFYEIRGLDRSNDYKNQTDIEKAARLIYLNKTCFNGLFRVNSQGQFNVPFGNYKNPNIVNEIVLKSIHKYLNAAEVRILNQDFEKVLETAKKDDFIYLDPPYDPVSDTSAFTGYTLNGFDKDEQIRLRDTFVELDKRGCKVMLSNSATDFIKKLYSEYDNTTVIVPARRNINSVGTKRGKIDEVLVMNYESKT